MVYLKNNIEAQTLKIPRNGEMVSGIMSLYVENTTDHQCFTLDVEDIKTSGLYFNLAVRIPEGIATGEYQYRLKDDDIIVSCGLIFIGDLKSPNQHQHEEIIKYKQYECD